MEDFPVSVSEYPYDEEGEYKTSPFSSTPERERREDIEKILANLSNHFFEYVQVIRKTKRGHGAKYCKKGLSKSVRGKINSRRDRICKKALELTDTTLVESVRQAIELLLGKEALIIQPTSAKEKKKQKEGKGGRKKPP